MEKVKSRTMKGDLDLMGSTSDWVLEAKAPNKQFSGFNNPTLGVVADGFDATVAWSKNQSGVRVKEGEELSKTKRDADFHRYLNLKKLYPDLHYKDRKSTRLNSSHSQISYAVFCLKKKNKNK